MRVSLREILLFAALLVFAGLFPAAAQESDAPTDQNLHQWGAISLFNGLPSNTVRAIAQTADGVLWFGTDGGLAKFDGRVIEKVSLPDSDAASVSSLAAAPDGSLWIGTDRGAIRFSGGGFYSIEETRGKAINSILIGRDGIFLGSAAAIFKVETGAENSLDVSEILSQDLKINALADGENALLLGSLGRGLISFSGGAAQEILTRPRPFFINVLARDLQNNLWLGADTGDKSSGLYLANNIARPELVGNAGVGTVTAISGGANDDLWVGTKNNGLFYLRGGQIIKNFTFANTAGGLRSNKIFNVFVDREKTVWIGTDRGISRYDAQSPFNRTFSADAAPNVVRTLYKTAAGKILAGTNRGLFAIANGAWNESENFSQKTVYAAAENIKGEIYVGAASGLYDFNGEKILTGDVRAVENFRGKIYAAVFGKGLVEIVGENQKIISENKMITALLSDQKNLLIGTGAGEVFTFDGRQITRSEQFNDLNGAAIWRIRQNNESLLFAAEKGLFVYRNDSVEKYLTDKVVRDAFIAENGEIWAATIGGGLFHLKFDETFGWLTANLTAEQGLPSASVFAILPLTSSEFLTGEDQAHLFYEILMSNADTASGGDSDYEYVSLRRRTLSADEAEAIFDQENDYQTVREPVNDRSELQRQYLELLIKRRETARAKTLLASIGKQLTGRYARPEWLRLIELRWRMREGDDALPNAERFIGISLDSAIVADIKPPSVERLNSVLRLLKEENLPSTALEIQKAFYARMLALGKFDAANFTGLARALFQTNDAEKALKILQIFAAAGGEENESVLAELDALEIIKRAAADRVKIGEATGFDLINQANALHLAAEIAAEFGRTSRCLRI